MAALAADVQCSTAGKTTNVQLSCNAADTFYKGAIVFVDTGGGAQVTWAAGDRPVGICPYKQTTTAASQEVEVIVEGLVWLPLGTNIAAADEGDLLLLDADGTTTDNPGDMVAAGDITIAAGDMVIGRIVRVTSSAMLVNINPALTGAIGTANTAVHFT